MMKKKWIALLLVLTLCVSAMTSLAAAGDPLISLSYLRSTCKPQLSQSLLTTLYPASGSGRSASAQIVMDQTRYKQGDVIQASTGCEIVVLAGTVTFNSAGTLIDVTHGTELSAGAALSADSRYLVGEDTQAALTVTSPTAVVSCNGAATVVKSTAPDYNAMADALKSLSLLQGTGTGFGSGYDLERKPTRVEAIVMFIRLLGEEDAALACTAKQPFSDVAPWADRYVAYACEKGYSNGAGGGKFASAREITAKEYVEFVMRALKYSSTAHTDLSTTLNDAKNTGVLTAGEYQLLTSEPLLRAHVVYLSYYALSTPVSGSSNTLEQQLISAGVFTEKSAAQAHTLITTARL